MFIRNKRIILPLSVFNKIVFIQIIFLFFAGVIYDSEFIFIQMVNLGLSWLFLWVLLNTIPFRFFIKNFIKANIFSAFLVVVGTILFAIGKLKLINVFQYQGEWKIYNFGFFFIKRTTEFENQLRPAGYYDEAGSFAFVVMFLLLLNRKYFKNMKWEYALLFLPLFTTSLAHIFTILIFGFLFYLNKKNVIKTIVAIGILSTIVIVFANGISSTESGSYFKERTIDRFEDFISGGEDVGRQGGLDLGPQIFTENPFGLSKEEVVEKYPEYVHETYWGPIIYYGVTGIGIYLLPFLYVGFNAINNRDKTSFFMLLIVFVNLLQRPYYMYPLFIILIYLLFFQESNNKNINQKNKTIKSYLY